MNLADITPVILTFNEEVNIARTLEHLHWAERIIVLDSGSTDDTAWICQSNPRVQWHQRPFDTFAGQWNYGRSLVRTPWMLALDADYLVPAATVEAFRLLETGDAAGFRIPFRYCIHGHPLRATLLPPRITLFRPEQTVVVEDGHTQQMQVNGTVRDLNATIWHDDRKPFSRWWSNQKKYAALEAVKLRNSCWSTLSPQDKLRKATPFSPLAVAAWCLLGKGLVFDLPWGWMYTGQRVLAEAALVWCRWGPGFKQD
jgi:glycosyltransferase involved in cell wall biosynthesis